MSSSVLAVDIGGTFTDLVLLAGNGRRLHMHKCPSTPPDFSTGLIEGALQLCEVTGTAPADIRWILHGTTVATNTLLQRTVRTAGRAMRAGGVSALAVAFLFAHQNPRHEKETGRALARMLPGVSVSLSSEARPEATWQRYGSSR